jgi:hypothetical protein
MTNFNALKLGLAAAGLLALSTTAAQAQMMHVALSGAAEKPGPGDPKGKGMAMITVDAAKSQVCYELEVSDIAPATMAHIHKGAPDAAGPVAMPLTAPDASGKSSACATVDPALAKDISANPGAYYVNVHNADFKAGAVRGQLGG